MCVHFVLLGRDLVKFSGSLCLAIFGILVVTCLVLHGTPTGVHSTFQFLVHIETLLKNKMQLTRIIIIINIRSRGAAGGVTQQYAMGRAMA